MAQSLLKDNSHDRREIKVDIVEKKTLFISLLQIFFMSLNRQEFVDCAF